MEYLINRCYKNLAMEKDIRDNLIDSLRDALNIAEDIEVNL